MNFLSSPILVLDAETRTGLAVIRSLGREGYRVIAASPERHPIGGSSRFVDRLFSSPDPHVEPPRYVEWLRAAIKFLQPAIVLPLTDVTVEICAEMSGEFDFSFLPLAVGMIIHDVLDKSALIGRARRLGIGVPDSVEIPSATPAAADIQSRIESFGYPAVLKPARTAAAGADGFVKFGVSYPAGPAAVGQLVAAAKTAGIKCPLLLQEKITGPGVGVFALCWQGKILIECAHRRLLEKPPSGGVSVLSESIPIAEAPADQARRLLADLKWSGAAMVEFKLRADGTPILMEINPRFWGSLQLAIDSGCDFPVLLVQLATAARGGERSLNQFFSELEHRLKSYRPGRRLRWTLGTIDHLIIRLKKEGFGALANITAANQLHLFERPFSTSNEVLRFSDLPPAAAELKSWVFGSTSKAPAVFVPRPLKILQFIETGGAGGAERVVSVLMQAFIDDGHSVEVATSRTGWLTETLARTGIPHHLITSTRRLDHTLPLRLSGLIRAGNFDILHSHLLDSNFYGAFAARMAGVPHIGTEHGDVHLPDAKKLLRTKLITTAILGSRFTAVSNFSANRLVSLGVPGRKITRIPNPVMDELFEVGRRRRDGSPEQFELRRALGFPPAFITGRIWLHVAAMRPVKDQATLLRGFARTGPDQFLVMVGEGSEHENLIKLADELRIADRIYFAGFHNNIPQWLEAADGFILTSKSEAMPMALLEAGAAGLLLVCSDVGGVREVLPGEDYGFLFPSGDHGKLGQILADGAGSQTSCRELIERSKAHISSEFSLQRVVNEYISLFNSTLIDSSKKRPGRRKNRESGRS